MPTKSAMRKIFFGFLFATVFTISTANAQTILDASIEQLVSPLAPHNNELEFVKIRIKNKGNVAITSVSIKWKINGVFQTTNTSTSVSIPVASSLNVNPTAVITMPVSTIPDNFSNVYEFYIERVNGVLSTNTSNDTLRAQFDSPLSGTKTIGELNSDYKTIGDAVNAIRYNGIAGNLTFKIKPGIYTDPIQLLSSEIYFSNTVHPAIKFESFSNLKDVQIITDKTIKSSVLFDGIRNATVRNLKVKNNCEFTGIGIQYVNVANNGLIYNCDVVVDSISNQKAFAGICLGDIGPPPTYSIIHVSKVNYTRVSNCKTTGGTYGILAAGFTNTPDTLTQIDSNEIKQVSHYGILAQNQINTKINKNRIVFRPSADMLSAGIHLKAVRTILPGIITVSQNYVRGAGFSGIYLLEVLGIGFPSNRLVDVSNNMIAGGFLSNTTIDADIPKGIYLLNSGSINIYFNSVNMDAPVNVGTIDKTSALYLLGSTSTGIINVLNNNLINRNEGYAYYNASASGSNPVLNSDHNNYWVEKLDTVSSISNGFAFWNGAARVGLHALQIINNRDRQSISIDPKFISNSDLHTYATGLNQRGSSLPTTTVDVDFDGDLRDQFGNQDIGADEIVQNGDDFSITDVSPRVFIPNQSTPWQITLAYYGPNVGNGSLYIRYKIDGVDQVLPDSAILINVTGLSNYGKLTFNVPTKNYITRTNFNSFRLTVYISTGNIGDLLAKNDTLSVDVCMGLNGTYTLDPAGTGPRNFKTFSDLFEKLQCGISGPTTIEIAEGTYKERLMIGDIQNTSNINTLTFTSITKNAAKTIITSNEGTESRHGTITLNNAKHVIIKNLCIENKATLLGSAIHITGNSKYNSIENNIIRMDTISEINSNMVFAIVASKLGTVNSGFARNSSYNIIRNNKIAGGHTSIYLMGTDTNIQDVGNIIEGNTITAFIETAIDIRYSNANILNNTIVGSLVSPSSRNGIFLYGIGDASGKENVRIDGNKIMNVYNYGISVGLCRGVKNHALKKYSFLLTNNMIGGTFNTTSTGVTGILLTFSNDIMILHNTVYVDAIRTSSSTPSEAVARCVRIANTCNEIELHNNILYSTNGSIPLDFYTKSTIGGTGNTGLVNSNNNVFYTSFDASKSTPLILIIKNTNTAPTKTIYSFSQITQTPYDALVNFRSNATNTGKETKSHAFAIDFTSAPNDLHTFDLQVEGRANRGFNVLTDFDKQSRKISTDIGADEFVSAPIDIEVTSIVNNVLNSTKPNTLSVLLTNRGYLNIVNQPTILRYTVKSLNNATIAIVNDTVNLNIQVSKGFVHNFNKKLVLPGANTYLICVESYLLIDTVDYNNSVCKEICTGADGNYYVGFNRQSPLPNTDTAKYFASLNEALQSFECGISGETNIFLNPANSPYIERVSIPKYNLSIDNPLLTIRPYNTTDSNAVVIDATTSGSPDYLHHTIQLNGASYVKLYHLTIKNTGQSFGTGVHITNNAKNNIIEGCVIEVKKINVTGDLHYGIAFTADKKLDINNINAFSNSGNYNSIINNRIIGGTAGIAMIGFSDGSNIVGNKIKNNNITEFSKYGIFARFAAGYEISNNFISPNTFSTFLVKSIAVYNASNGGIINANTLDNTNTEGIKVLGVNAISSNPLIISNNWISSRHIPNMLDSAGSIAIKRSRYVHVYHNNIWYDGSNFAINLSQDSVFSTSQNKWVYFDINNIRVINNIVFVDSNVSNSRKPRVLYYNSSDQSNVFNYNAYYNTYQNMFARTRSLVFKTFADWRILTGRDAFSVNELATFVSNTDLNLINQNQFNQRGITLNSVTKDYYNQIRNPRKGSIGAVDYSSSVRDISVYSLGVNAVTYGQNEFSCYLINEGSGDLSADTVALEYSVDTGITWLGYQLVKLDSLNQRFKLQYVKFNAKYTISNLQSLPLSVRISPLKRLKNDTRDTLERIDKILCVGLNAGEYKVSKTDASADFVSIQQALDALNCGFNNHVIFTLDNGTYQEDLIFGDLPSLQNKKITFRAKPNANVIWKTFSSSRKSIVELYACENITFENIQFEGSKTSDYVAVHLLDSVNNINFINCKFNLPINSSVNQVYAISTYRANPFTRSRAVKNIRIENCEFKGGNTAINIKSNNQPNNSIDIINNVFSNIYSNVININASNVDSISNNKIDLKNSFVSSSGIRLTNLKQSFVVNNNTILNCSDESLFIDSTNFIGDGFVLNNMMVSSDLRDGVNSNIVTVKNFGEDVSRSIFTAGKLYFYFNSLSHTEKSAQNDPSVVLNFEKSNNLVLYGNIATNYDKSLVLKLTTGDVDSSEFINTYNNLLYTNGPVLASWRNVMCSTLTVLGQQDAGRSPFKIQNSPKGLGSFSPNFRNKFDLHVNDIRIDGSALKPMGIISIPFDIDSEPIGYTNIDIGCDQFDFENDLAIKSFISPLENESFLGANIEVKLVLENKGKLLSNTNIKYVVDDVLIDSLQLQFSPSLATDSMYTYTFAKKYSTLRPGTHTLKAFVEVRELRGSEYVYADFNKANDTLSVQFITIDSADLRVQQFITPVANSTISIPTKVVLRISNTGTTSIDNYKVILTKNGAILKTAEYIGVNSIAPNFFKDVDIDFTITPSDNNTHEYCAYTILVGDYNHSNDTSCINVSTAVGINNVAFDYIEFYPNPVVDVMKFNSSIDFNNAHIKIYNTLGQLLQETVLNGNDLNVEQLPEGIYMFVLNNKVQQYRGTFIKN